MYIEVSAVSMLQLCTRLHMYGTMYGSTYLALISKWYISSMWCANVWGNIYDARHLTYSTTQPVAGVLFLVARRNARLHHHSRQGAWPGWAQTDFEGQSFCLKQARCERKICHNTLAIWVCAQGQRQGQDRDKDKTKRVSNLFRNNYRVSC